MPTTHTRQPHPNSLRLLTDAAKVCGGLNQFAKRFGIPWSTVANVSSGRTPMPPAMAVAAADVLGWRPIDAIASVLLEHRPGTWETALWLRLAREGDLV